MKKFLAILVIAAAFTACSDPSSTEETVTDTVPVTTAPVDAPAPAVDTAAVAPVDTATVK